MIGLAMIRQDDRVARRSLEEFKVDTKRLGKLESYPNLADHAEAPFDAAKREFRGRNRLQRSELGAADRGVLVRGVDR
ncbi:MAG: hypothetical protein AAF333_10960 [Planctomycetota bacterium]